MRYFMHMHLLRLRPCKLLLHLAPQAFHGRADKQVSCPYVAGELGSSLVRSAAVETAQLDPPHTYVPWVVVNGVALGDAYPYLRSFICVALGSGDKPRACGVPGSAAHSLRAPS